jgi:flagellar hook-basal body complex protein FliE
VPIDGLNNNYAILPSLTTTGRVQNTFPYPTMEEDRQTPFADLLSQAMGDTVASDYESKTLGIDLLLGGEADLHSIPIAQQKADILLNLTVQIRNKMVESYQEIMRMQV